jgi:hypothetical protein
MSSRTLHSLFESGDAFIGRGQIRETFAIFRRTFLSLIRFLFHCFQEVVE